MREDANVLQVIKARRQLSCSERKSALEEQVGDNIDDVFAGQTAWLVLWHGDADAFDQIAQRKVIVVGKEDGPHEWWGAIGTANETLLRVNGHSSQVFAMTLGASRGVHAFPAARLRLRVNPAPNRAWRLTVQPFIPDQTGAYEASSQDGDPNVRAHGQPSPDSLLAR